jgi:hypothetical protein
MYYSVVNVKNSVNNSVQIIECAEQVQINLDDENIKLLNVDNIKMPHIIGVAYITYSDLYTHKKIYNITYYEVQFDYDNVYFFGLTYEKALQIQIEITNNFDNYQ